MKLLYSLLFLSLITNAQQTYIPDDNFELALIELGYDSGAPDNYVLTENINTIETLDLSNRSIQSMVGIEDFTALLDLDLSFNNIFHHPVSIDLYPASLISLDLSYNNFYADMDLSSLVNLEYFNIQNNLSLENLTLNNNVALTYLNISYTAINNIDVSALVNLTHLYISNLEIVNINLTNNTLLTDIFAATTFLETLDITQNILLERLNLDDSNEIHTLDLSNNVSLQHFSASSNGIRFLDFSNNPNLTSLHITGSAAFLNLANGNNTNITNLYLNVITAQCVTVDNETIAYNWNHGIDLPNSYQSYGSSISSTSQPCPENDFHFTASSLQIGNTPEDFVLIGDNEFATAAYTQNISYPSSSDCGGNPEYSGGDLWYKIIVPEDGAVIVETSHNDASDILDTGMAIYRTVDYNLTLACNNDINVSEGNYFSKIALIDQTPGEVLRVRVWEPGNDIIGTFRIAAYRNPEVSTYIPDDNFQQALIDLGIDTSLETDDYVNTQEIETITSLDVSNKNIADLTGIENFTGLVGLDCSSNNLESLDLSNNLSLQNLNATNNLNLDCIKVADEDAANSGSGIYSNWIKDGATTYSETCQETLSMSNKSIETISVYPNPTNETLHINIPSTHILEHLTILTSRGQVIETYSNKSIDVSNLKSGFYFINIQTNKGSIIRKIIKK